MVFRRWILQNRLKSTEQKLRRLRYDLKMLREKLEEKNADKTKLEARRHEITAQIDTLAHKEKALKAELASET